MDDLISRAAAIEDFAGKPPEYYSTEYICDVLNELPTADAIPIDFLMRYAQMPTEFAIEAWRKPQKEELKRRIRDMDKPMSFDDAVRIVDMWRD